MTLKQFFNRDIWIRIGLFVASLALIVFFMPRSDHQSYTYEVNQPWKYPLLTAEFDVPILRDSTTANAMRDSINANFVPFVKKSEEVRHESEQRLRKILNDSLGGRQTAFLVNLLDNLYSRGILEEDLDNTLEKGKLQKVRMVGDDPTLIETVGTADMVTPARAFAYIDSMYRVSVSADELLGMSGTMAKAVYESLAPNVTLDSATDEKFRSQELLEVAAAFGVIKKGQRIVDRGEIVTPQIYTNLNTYMTMLEETEDEHLAETYHTIGRGAVVLFLLILLYIFLYVYRNEFYRSNSKMTFLMAYITLFVLAAIFMFEYINNGLFLLPFAAIPIVLIVFFDARTAIFSLLVTVLIVSMIATFPHQFILMELIAGLSATFCLKQLTRRSQLLLTAFVSFIAYLLSYTALIIFRDGNFDGMDYRLIGYFAVNSVILSFAYVMIFLIEKIFGFTSNVTLVELSDINNSLLRRLAEEAPGTFQHSMQVSTLAAEAANAINANTLLVRTGALYHDIGKLESPIFFTENQHGVNPHLGLNPETSAQKIISHVNKGVALAHKKKLPKVIRDFILEHHGKGVAKYFYNTAMNENGGQGVDIEKFRYPGPNPQSKETVLLMMADAVEAASRSLKEYTQESINNLVDKIIDGQMADGLYADAPISFKEVKTVKNTFKKRLATLYHTRVAYPDLKAPAAPKPQ